MVQNMENIDFRTFFAVTSQQWPLLKWNCDLWVPWNISDQIHRILCPNLVYFLRKCTKFSKIRPRGAVPPKKPSMNDYYLSMILVLFEAFLLMFYLCSKNKWSVTNFVLLSICYVISDKCISNIFQETKP